MSKNYYYFICSLLLATGWANALAQGTPAVSPAQRLKLDLVDNRSTFVINEQQGTYENHYVNTLSLSQPGNDNPNKFTAGMLNEGDNYIVFSRQGDTETAPTEFARINLKRTPQNYPDEVLDGLTFENISSTGSLDAQLPENWSSSGLNGNRNGYAYISGGQSYHLSYTIPADLNIHNCKVVVYIYTTSSGYFLVGEWIQSASANTWNRYILNGMSASDVIKIQGITRGSSGYSYGQSPNITQIQIEWMEPMVPVFDVTPSWSSKGGNGWSDETELGSATAYSPNDVISFDGLNMLDDFSVSTEGSYPESYSYTATVDANIEFPANGSSTGNFYASADYQHGDGTIDGIVLSGPNNWDYEFVGTSDGDVMCLWLPTYGNLLYTMPANFTGTSVNVTMIADTGEYGSGSIMVNGVSHTFAAGETYTWTVPVSANGTILLAWDPNSDVSYTLNVSKIIISSGSGSSLNAPSYTTDSQMTHKELKHIGNITLDNRQLLPTEIKIEYTNSKNIQQ